MPTRICTAPKTREKISIFSGSSVRLNHKGRILTAPPSPQSILVNWYTASPSQPPINTPATMVPKPQ